MRLVIGEGPHRAARPLHEGETNPFGESSDTDFVPDIALSDGQRIDGDGWSLTAILTPGHTANHAAFALDGRGILFSADHSWPGRPRSSRRRRFHGDYMASLERLLARDERFFFQPWRSGEGPAGLHARIAHPTAHARTGRAGAHPGRRTADIRHGAGDLSRHRSAPAWAAALSVLAHLEDLVDKGQVLTDGPARLGGVYLPG